MAATDSSRVRNAFYTLGEECLPRITSWYAAGQRPQARLVERIVRPDRDTVGVGYEPQANWLEFLRRHDEDLRGAAAYAELVDAFDEVDYLKAYAAENIRLTPWTKEGLRYFLWTVVVEDFLAALARESIERNSELDECFADLYAAIDRELRGMPEPITVLAFCVRLFCMVSEVRLGGNAVVRTATDDDRNAWLDAVDFDSAKLGANSVLLPMTTVIDLSVAIPRHHRIDYAAALRPYVLTIRLLKGGSFSVPTVIYFIRDDWRKGRPIAVTLASARTSMAGLGTTLEDRDSTNARLLWESYSPTILAPPSRLAVALSRLDRALGDGAVEDRLIDCCVGFDALFAPAGPEMTYRVRTRAAFLLGRTAEERRRIDSDLDIAYKLRGAIVHGSRAPEDAFKRQLAHLNSHLDPNSFVVTVGALLQRSILAFLVLAGRSGTDVVFDWSQRSADALLDGNVLTGGEDVVDIDDIWTAKGQ